MLVEKSSTKTCGAGGRALKLDEILHDRRRYILPLRVSLRVRVGYALHALILKACKTALLQSQAHAT